jgi:hypothetical protein
MLGNPRAEHDGKPCWEVDASEGEVTGDGSINQVTDRIHSQCFCDHVRSQWGLLFKHFAEGGIAR